MHASSLEWPGRPPKTRFAPVAEQSAAFFYEKLFELDPEAERLFARTDMDAQGRKVMRMLSVPRFI